MTFQVKGTKFHQGKLAICFVPLTKAAKVNEWQRTNFCALTSCQHVLIDPAESSVAEIDIPYKSPRHYLQLVDHDTAEASYNFLGTVFAVPFNQLGAVTGTIQTIDVSVMVSFYNNEFKIPRPLPATFITTRMQAKRRGAIPITAMAQGNSIFQSYNIKKAGTLTIGNQATGDEIARGASADVSGLDKPNTHLEPILVTPLSLGFFSNGTNVTTMERFAMDPGALDLPTKETFGTSEDEMDMKFLTMKMNWIKTVAWTTTQPVGQQLWKTYLCPLSRALAGELKKGQTYAIPMIDYASAKFSFWKGSLMYKIQVVSSSFQTGKLLFAVHYGNNGTLPTTLGDTTAQYGVYLDLSEKTKEWLLKVPFYAPFELRVPDGPETTTYNRDKFSMGQAQLVVINALVANNETLQSVEINVSMCGGDDYELYYLGANNVMLEPTNIEITARAQGEIVVAPSDSTVMSHHQDRYDSVQTILKRFTRCYNAQAYEQAANKVTGPTTNYIPLDMGRMLWRPPSNITAGPTAGEFTDGFRQAGLFTWFGVLYRANRGSLRFKVSSIASNQTTIKLAMGFTPDAGAGLAPEDQISFIIEYNEYILPFSGAPPGAPSQIPIVYYATTGIPYTVSTGVGNTSLLVEVPYASQYQFLLTPLDAIHEADLETTDLGSQGALYVHAMYAQNTDPTNSQAEASFLSFYHQEQIYVGAGDEFRLGIFLGPPYVRVASNSVFPDTYTD